MRTIMVTGATRGLGLEIASQVAAMPDTRVIMAVRNLGLGLEFSRRLGDNVSAVHLDLSELKNVGRFVKEWEIGLDGLVNNAGVQFSRSERFTADGFEETIAVNHLAAFMLTVGLEDFLAGGRVLFMGSGTHNPHHRLARVAGFDGARFTTVQDAAEGRAGPGKVAHRNRERYATSKLLNMVTAVELSRRNMPYQSYALDPGLMPGTGLLRTYSAFVRLLWKRVAPLMAGVLPDTSTPVRSGSAAAWILTEDHLGHPSGTIFSYDRKPSTRVWDETVRNPEIGAEVFNQSMAIVEKFLT